jgi:hypothetical protein
MACCVAIGAQEERSGGLATFMMFRLWNGRFRLHNHCDHDYGIKAAFSVRLCAWSSFVVEEGV